MTQPVSRDEFDKALNSVREKISGLNEAAIEISTENKNLSRRVEKIENEHDNICQQLVATERDMRKEFRDGLDLIRKEHSSSHNEVMGAINGLINDKARREGAEGAAIGIAKHAPKILWAVFTAGMITVTYITAKGGNP